MTHTVGLGTVWLVFLLLTGAALAAPATVILLGFNLGVLALVRPIVADPVVLHFHAPYLMGVALLVAVALLTARRLGRGAGAALTALYLLYLLLNIPHMWQSGAAP